MSRCNEDCFNCKFDDCVYETKTYHVVSGKCMGFGKRLKEAIKSEGLSQAEVSRRTGITEASICQYVHGRTYPRGDHIAVLCITLKCSADWLLGVKK